ncbi:CobB/CobQ domain protein glutamine amidotransferase [Thermobaculum terrenum ATCC BAA-798]|uniref:Lipid II isoglutaminyl synthase (glutamine-hydrolyzing) subunit GatD n=1 Tax=Thermobaculum terrenum (strain ATCC BAA-798 / CCMEE 7001 / YNP1) TaxID=525904 RepID=D1CCL7_THET1|nr:glutamine amidotransferase [Thermobaculum terrenum]ACZ42532.1 CobB/CobQ domain protein glutamine amidotransferase [Thermobaculum terrenum ATCC BAA-798]
MELRICFLYGGLMNIYGDRGNVIALAKRAQWRGIAPIVKIINPGDPIDPDYFDVFVFGGGQDKEQYVAARDLQKLNGERLRVAVDYGAVVLAVCGGYQLLGLYYQPWNAPRIEGVGLINSYTIAGNERFIGNVIVDSPYGKLVGFENHSGLTYLGEGVEPLGEVLKGKGNNGTDGTEGVISGTVFGTYMHGPILPKNHLLTDHILGLALSRRYGKIELSKLDDTFEFLAHDIAAARPR